MDAHKPVHDLLLKHYEPLPTLLHEDVMEALSDYQGGSGVNDFHRGNRKYYNTDENLRLTRDIDRALRTYLVPKDITVYRCVGDVFKPRLFPGRIFIDKAYMSTSLSEDATHCFAEEGSNTFLTINVPAGARAVYFPAVFPGNYDEEWELLLARRTRFRVDSVQVEKVEGSGRRCSCCCYDDDAVNMRATLTVLLDPVPRKVAPSNEPGHS